MAKIVTKVIREIYNQEIINLGCDAINCFLCANVDRKLAKVMDGS